MFNNLNVIDIPEHGVPRIGKSDFENPKGWVNIDNQPPFIPGWTKDDYLKLVESFEDKIPLIVKEHDGISVVRDDLIPGGLGSKVRYSTALMSNVKEKYIFYAGVPQGQAMKVLAHVCKQFNKILVCIAPWRKSPTPTHLEAMNHGAIFMFYRTGGQAGARKRCRAFINDQLKGSGFYVAAGVKNPLITAGFMKSAMQLNSQYTPDAIFCACSTGVMAHGLALAFPNAEIHAVQVAGNSSTKKHPGRLIVHNHAQPFNDSCKFEDRPPFNSILEYDAKAWKWALDYKNAYPEKKILFWNVTGEMKNEK
jgi:1-aminocyclopropane-1-carboxylate deaminase/D-cysteine desulfhydrase-like pyridoxal-dependent ACC family enzyme